MLNSHLQPPLQRQRWPLGAKYPWICFITAPFCTPMLTYSRQGVVQLGWITTEAIPPLVAVASARGSPLCPQLEMLLDS